MQLKLKDVPRVVHWIRFGAKVETGDHRDELKRIANDLETALRALTQQTQATEN